MVALKHCCISRDSGSYVLPMHTKNDFKNSWKVVYTVTAKTVSPNNVFILFFYLLNLFIHS